jgi:hypothetical protein
VRGVTAALLCGIAVDHGTRVLAPNDRIDTAEACREEDVTPAPRCPSDSVTPPPDAAAFRVDFPRFLRGLSERDRALAMFLPLGRAAKKAAAKFHVSPGRVTRPRQRSSREWRRSQGEEVGD